ncbi:acyltransferase family protein [Phytohalomonas tamaricis]|uniref:acyltransferase family protein n=1 Tax=Phytohalomonas tamaricis TaxID=2081032 RepID=UPI00131A24A4|nr:acyltransferase [Phytohalomonas tamaricis]
MVREKFVALDWLRFGLAIYLVLFHTIREYSEISDIPALYSALSLGFFSTSTFFVLSGFLLAHVYIGRNTKARFDTKSFFIKRFASLYPLHLLALAIAIPLMMTTSANMGEIHVTPNTNSWLLDRPDIDARALSPTGFITNLSLHFTMLHAWNPIYTTFNSPTWSLSALFFFYLTFPFFAPRISKTRRPLILLTVLCIIYSIPAWIMFIADIQSVVAHGLLHRNPLLRLPEFLAGIMLYVSYVKYNHWLRHKMTSTHIGAMLMFIVASFAATAYLHSEVGEQWYYLVHNGLLLPAQLMLVLLCACYQPSAHTSTALLASRLGCASLSVFALHVPLNIIASKAEKVVLALYSIIENGGSLSSFITVAMQQQRELELYPVYLFATIIICVVFQEQLVNRIRQALQNRLLPAQARLKRASPNSSYRRAQPE